MESILLRVAFFATTETSSWLIVTGLRAIGLVMAFFATLEAAFLAFATILAGFGTVCLAVAFFAALKASPGEKYSHFFKILIFLLKCR